jgi:hypothetical protein
MGCSGGGDSPVTPDTGPGLTSGVSDHGAQVQTHLWGYWTCYVDIENQTVEAVPLRTTLFAANVVGFLNSNNSLSFIINDTPVTPDYTDVDIDITLTHPLPGLPSYDGYDVRGIFIGDGSQYMQYNSDLSYGVHDVDQTMLADPDGGNGAPDGYSRWYNAMEFTGAPPLGFVDGAIASQGYTGNCTLNPYRYFADGLMANDDLWTWLLDNPDVNGLFASGMSNTRNYYIRFPTAKGINYDYAVVANWKGEDLVLDHPAPAPEMVGCSVDIPDPPTIYYVDSTTNGGLLYLDISLFNWEYQPSTIYVESTVLSSYYTFTTEMTPVGGDDTYSTYHCEIPADNVTGLEDQEFWVIAENEGFDYTNEFGVPNLADTDYLAAFFRYDLPITDVPPCPVVTPDSITPATGGVGSNVDDAVITVTPVGDLEAGPDLAATLTRAGETDIPGTDVNWVDDATLTADFDLTGAAEGFWNVVVANGCGAPAGVGPDLFEVVAGGIIEVDSGDLPGPDPTANWVDMCVVGNNGFGHAGVYYHYTTGSNYLVYHYPIDYSAAATQHVNITDPFFGNIGGLLLSPAFAGSIEVMATGPVVFTYRGTGPMTWGGYPADGPVWWCGTDGQLDNGYIYFNMQFQDLEREFSTTGRCLGYWGNNPAGVDGASFYLNPPYGAYDYGSYTGYYPADHSGHVDCLVADVEADRYAVDSDPQGLSSPFNIIHYYCEDEGAPYNIEVMQNVTNIAFPTCITTIDDEMTGSKPIDVGCLQIYGELAMANGQWLCVLEDDGAGGWFVETFEQDGTLIYTSATYTGTPWALDVDIENDYIHVWAEATAGDWEYYIFECV